MARLLSIEWIKLKKYKAFWVLLLLFALACIGINTYLFHLQSKVTVRSGGALKLDLFGSQNLWHTTAWLTNFILILPGVLVILLMANEFSYKTLRQQIINGFSRTEALVSKWLLLICLAVGCWVIYLLTVFIMGRFFLHLDDVWMNFYYAGYAFINIILCLSVAFILAIWIKRSGLTIAIYLVYCFFIENIFDYFLSKINVFTGNFLPLSSGTSLTPSPFNKLLGNQASLSHPADYWYILAAVLWIVIIHSIALRYIRRADL